MAYAGLPDFRGDLDLATGRVTEEGTGIVRGWHQWQLYVQGEIVKRHQQLMRDRDLSSDLENLPGYKPWFKDTWFDMVPTQQRPRSDIVASDPWETPGYTYPSTLDPWET